MSLVEKVNVTTGVGWMMDLCVGNTGKQAPLSGPKCFYIDDAVQRIRPS